MILMPDHTSSDMENRTLQTFPKLTFSTLVSGKFESEFETYIADQFPFRNKWITLESTVSRMMGKTESNDIFLAKGGYLIQNFHTPSDEQYASLLEGYKGIAKLTEGTDITLNAMIVPTAVNIYSKKLPFGAVKGDQKAFLTHEKKRRRSVNSSVNLFFSCADGDTDLGGEVGWRQPFIGRAALDDRIPKDDHVIKPFGHFTVVKGVIFHCDDLLLFLSEIAGKTFDFAG